MDTNERVFGRRPDEYEVHRGVTYEYELLDE